jgi:hypothetical protein
MYNNIKPIWVSNKLNLRNTITKGMAATTPGNILEAIVLKRMCPPPVFHRAKLYAAGNATTITSAVLPKLIISELPKHLKYGNWINKRLKFSNVGVNINCLFKVPANISEEDLNAVKYIHKSGPKTPTKTSNVIIQNKTLLKVTPLVFNFHLLSFN